MQYPNYLILRISFIHTMHTQKTGSRLTIYTHVGGQFRKRKSTNQILIFEFHYVYQKTAKWSTIKKIKVIYSCKLQSRRKESALGIWICGQMDEIWTFLYLQKSENSHISNFKLKISYLNLLILGTFNFC